MSLEERNKNGDFALSNPERSNTSLTELMHAGMGIPSPFMKEIYLLRQVIVGTRYQGGSDELVEDLHPGSRISFVAEPDNKYDENAVMALDSRGRKLGYIPRHENAVLGALLKAGKSIYGIIPDEPSEERAVAPGSERTPYAIWVDLYMREFLLPDDMDRIPRQGYQGSYALVDFVPGDDQDRQISSIYAIKVINGTERDSFRWKINGDDPESGREAIEAFQKYVGYLPLVGHDITEEIVPKLEEAYGVLLGMPFSNHVIDTLQMAANHMPRVRNASLDHLAEELGIEVRSDSPQEARCRIIWQLYSRMERSELTKSAAEDTADAVQKRNAAVKRLDLPVEEYPMSSHARTVLLANRILTLRELSRYSMDEVSSFRFFEPDLPGELTKLLAGAGGAFRPEGTEQILYGYPRNLQRTAMKKEDCWEYLLLFGAFTVYYKWLQNVRMLPLRMWQRQEAHRTITNRQEMLRFLNGELEMLQTFVEDMHDAVNIRCREAVGAPGEPGSVEEIMNAVEEMMTVCKRIILWQRAFQFIGADPEYRNMIEGLTEAANDLLAGFDDLYERSVSAISQIEAFLAGEPETDRLRIDMNIHIQFHSERIAEALKNLK